MVRARARKVWRGAAILAALVCALARPALAQDDIAAAEALFRQGRALLEGGQLQEACKLLEESLRIDPGTGTMWHLARCYEGLERLASAWALYLELEAEARRLGQSRRAEAGRRAAAAIEPRLSRLVIEVGRDAPPGLEVQRDGRPVREGAWGTAVPVDPGVHVVRATAAGFAPFETSIDVAAGATERIAIDALAPMPGPRVAPWHADVLGWSLAAGGVVLMSGGGFALARSAGLEDDAAAPGIDLNERDELLDRAGRARTIGIGLAVAGGAALAAGIVRLALTPDSPADEPAIEPQISSGPGGITLGLRGRW